MKLGKEWDSYQQGYDERPGGAHQEPPDNVKLLQAIWQLIADGIVYGSDAGLTFAISTRAHGSLGRFPAHLLRMDAPDRITYRLRGIASKNRAELHRRDFHALLSIGPL